MGWATARMKKRILLSILLGSSPIICPAFVLIGERWPSSAHSSRVVVGRRLYLSALCLPDIDGMRMSEIRKELESYGVPVRSSWASPELITALKRARVENAERRRLAKLKQDKNENRKRHEEEMMRQVASYYYEQALSHERAVSYEPPVLSEPVVEPTMNACLLQPSCVDAEPIVVNMMEEHDEPRTDNNHNNNHNNNANNNNNNKKVKRPVIARIGGFLTRKREKSKVKPQRVNSAKNKLQWSEDEELPFFLEFLDRKKARNNNGPISVEVVRLQTWTRDSDDEADTRSSFHSDSSYNFDGKRKRILYTKGLGSSSNYNKNPTKRKPEQRKIAIVPLGEEEHDTGSSSNSFIGTFSKGGKRRVDFHHPYQVVAEDETTKTHKLLHDDPTLMNCTVIDVPVKQIQFDWRDPDLFSRLKCDDWDGFSA